MCIPPNTMYHHNPYNQRQRTKIEMKIASFLSITFFPFLQPTIKNENRYKDSLHSPLYKIYFLKPVPDPQERKTPTPTPTHPTPLIKRLAENAF